MPVVVSPRRRIASRGTLRAMQLQAVQCSSPSGPRDAALQSSLNAGQESSNRQRSGLFTRTQVAYALVAAKCTVLASVLQDASKRRRAKPIFALGISIGARRRCHRSPLHPHQPLRHHHSPRSLSNLKHSPESILARGTAGRHRHRAKPECSSPPQLHKAAAASSPPGPRAGVEWEKNPFAA